MRNERPDLVVLAGDYCGNFKGSRCTRITFELARETLGPDIPILACLGNHDYWTIEPWKWAEEWEEILDARRSNEIHLLETDGLYRQDGWTFLGHGLWYGTRAHEGKTNNYRNMPLHHEGDTCAFMQKRGHEAVDSQVAALTGDDLNLVFVSHFPVVDLDAIGKVHGGPEGLGNAMKDLGVRKFLNGHTHGNLGGPLRYECGGDYGRPQFKIIDL